MNESQFPVELSLHVRWGEMDALGHVNNAFYFKYFEDARIEYFKHLDYETFSASDEVGPVLAQISCQFKRAIVYPDTIRIRTWVVKIGNSSMQMDYSVFSESQNAEVATGSSIVVMINYQTNQKVRISDGMRERIQQFQGTFERPES